MQLSDQTRTSSIYFDYKCRFGAIAYARISQNSHKSILVDILVSRPASVHHFAISVDAPHLEPTFVHHFAISVDTLHSVDIAALRLSCGVCFEALACVFASTAAGEVCQASFLCFPYQRFHPTFSFDPDSGARKKQFGAAT